MNVFKELERFQTDRNLHKQEFDLRVATMNILEELLEAHGISDNKNRDMVNSLYKRIFSEQIQEIYQRKLHCSNLNGFDFNTPSIEDQVDAFCDIQVFAGGEIGKLGYNNEQCMGEVSKEINSRIGSIIDGKFTKDKSPEAQANWYKANFDDCKINY